MLGSQVLVGVVIVSSNILALLQRVNLPVLQTPAMNWDDWIPCDYQSRSVPERTPLRGNSS